MRIMHVEDEMIVSMAVRSLLEKHGHTVCAQTGSGEAALEAFADARPDLVLMDIMLGGKLDGIETAARLKAVRDVPVIFISAYGDDKTRARAEVLRPAGFLVKPLDAPGLLRAVAQALGGGNGGAGGPAPA